MSSLRLTAALLAVCLGGLSCARRKQPLFFKILLFGAASYFLGALFECGWMLVYGAAPEGFHVGGLGYMGMWFFLFSSYFGAIDRLADGGERQYRLYRVAALAGPLAVLGLTGWSLVRWGAAACTLLLLLAVPMSLTLYFALKQLLLPDVEMGIIRVMRPYNLCVVLLGLCQAAALLPDVSGRAEMLAGVLLSALLVVMPPVAEMGVRKWFM